MTSQTPEPHSNNATSQIQGTEDESERTKKTTFSDYNDILDHIGPAGRYQMRIFLLLCLPVVFTGPMMLSYSFTGAVPTYR